MSKYIKFTQEQIEKLKAEFEAAISNSRAVDGEFSFKKTIESVDAKATLRFSDRAYLKMTSLVKAFDKEVAWHCVTERGEAENEYLITDILVYPQTVTGVTVEMDTEEYAKWIERGILAEDERFFQLHGQGHSHVNMGTSPSGTDLNHQRGILADMRQNGFYIFIIWNKRDEHTIWIYDLGKNIVFENKDIRVQIGEDDELSAFLIDANNIVKNKVSPITSYVGGYSAQNFATKPTVKHETAKPVETKPVEKPAEKAFAKPKEKVKAKVASAPIYPYERDDYNGFDDPTSPFYVSDNIWR